jgi:F-type H+-transporting ATPase subunit a
MLMKIKKIPFLVLVLNSPQAFSGEGFTWIGFFQSKFNTHIPEHIITFVLTGLFLSFLGLLYRSKLSKVVNIALPDKGITLRNLMELYGQFIYGQCKAVIGEKQAEKYFGFIATIFLLILMANLLGLIPGFLPPTEYLNTTLALGIFSFIYYNAVGCRELGVVNYIKHFAGPLWYMAILIFPIEIISNLIRPISLALRLRGNMYGDHLVLAKFTDLVPLLVPIAALLLGLLVCFIQAYVFTVLTMVYISLATAHHDHEEHHAH